MYCFIVIQEQGIISMMKGNYTDAKKRNQHQEQMKKLENPLVQADTEPQIYQVAVHETNICSH